MSAEASRFAAVGGVATLVAIVLFNLLVHGVGSLFDPPLAGHVVTAYVLANSIGMLISYHGSRDYAFRERMPVHADGGRTAYVVINVATMTLPVACLVFTHDVLHLDSPLTDNIAANVVGLGLGFAARFYLFRRFVFRVPPSVIALDEIIHPEHRVPRE